MKKLSALALSVLSISFAVSSVEAKTIETGVNTFAINAELPQIRVRIGSENNRRRNRRVIKTTRVSRNGRRVVTKTYRPNGRVVTRKRVIRRNVRY